MSEAGRAPDSIGVMDIGGGHVAVAIADGRLPGSLRRVVSVPLNPAGSRDELLATLSAPARELAADEAVNRWVIAIPGPFDYRAGRGSFAGVGKLQALAGTDLRCDLARRLGVEPSDVKFLNDAVAYGLGEWSAGAGGRRSRMVCLTLGTGVGSAFLAGGRAVEQGEGVPPGGDVHTLAVDGRPLEETISSPALRRRYRALSGSVASVEEICERARAGQSVAMRTIADAMTALGTSLAPAIRSFGADCLVVGGGMGRSFDVIGGHLRAGLASEGCEVEVIPASLGARAPLIGAAESW